MALSKITNLSITDDAVRTVGIQDVAVTGAKINDDAISGQGALGAAPADTDEFLVSDAGVLKRVDYSYLKANTPEFRVYQSSVQSIPNAAFTKIAFNTVIFDADNIYDETTNYDATLPSTGKWFIGAGCRFTSTTDWEPMHLQIVSGTTDMIRTSGRHFYYDSAYCAGNLDITDLANTITVEIYQASGGAINLDANILYTYFFGYKLT